MDGGLFYVGRDDWSSGVRFWLYWYNVSWIYVVKWKLVDWIKWFWIVKRSKEVFYYINYCRRNDWYVSKSLMCFGVRYL